MKKLRENLLKTFLLITLLIPITGNSQAIIGGLITSIQYAPYQVSIELNSLSGLPTGHLCGGIILSDTWILSAAHCFCQNGTASPVFSANMLIIHAGSTDQTNDNIGQRIQGLLPGVGIPILIHPNYNGVTFENDIALIQLSQPLQFNQSVAPIQFANSCNTTESDIAAPADGSPGPSAFLTGWGGTSNGSLTPSAILRGVSMPLIDRGTAEALNLAANVNYTTPITDNMLAFHQIGLSVGFGDSGGPAVITKNGNKIAIGIASWSGHPQDQLPSIYTNIRNYANWIEQKMSLPITSPNVDLYTKDKPWDIGDEPFSTTHPWTSEDIWVRNQNDGIEEHQNPEYYALPGNYNYVYVRVRNNGCVPSTGNEDLILHWTNAATALSWPNHWNGSLSVNNVTAGNNPIGGLIGTVTLPVIQSGDAYIATFQWQPQDPANFHGFASHPDFLDNPLHYCLLSRIVSTSDPMSVTETNDIRANVLNNNNIAWKNVSVVDLDPNNRPALNDDLIGAVVLVGDAWGSVSTYDMEFKNPNYVIGEPITDNAEITITLDVPIWNKWEQGGFIAENFEVINEEKKQIRLLAGSGKIKNLTFDTYERGLIHVGFNFLIEEIPQNS
jgi:secreted trypsin-like serine protease